ncbi:MAG: hypothetical protein RBU25_17970 [Lentisphaeria bacterium]|nr:hypothetical protein [Lentisphaeria bacterium]
MKDADYGTELACLTTIVKPKVMDVVVSGDYLYFPGQERLYVADITNPAEPQVVGECPFRGTGRQITVRDGIAYVTARANGVFIFDVREPRQPELLCHYDCLELATGVEVQGSLMFIAQRQFGVEIVNVADPRNPVYVSKIKTGEAQSVDARGSLIYVGDWGVCKLTTIDISDPYHPKIVSSLPMDGYGDGVSVAGDRLYASTGHHSRNMGAWQKEGDPGYGAGHGFEVFSIKNPAAPEFLGRTKFPKFYHRGGYDMWTPVAAGDSMVCCVDTFNGIFLVDVSNPAEPKTVAHYKELVAGAAVVDDIIYAACPEAGLKVISAPSLVRRYRPDRGAALAFQARSGEVPKDHRVYRPGGQVWAADFCGDYTLVAAGMKGLRVVDLWPEVREVATIETEGFAVHVSVCGDWVYVSENTSGLSVWRHTGDGRLEPRARFMPRNKAAVRQCLTYAKGTRAIVQADHDFLILDVSDPAQPRQIARYHDSIVYGDQMSHGDVGDRYACAWSHVNGVRWLDFAKSGKEIDTGINLNDRYQIFSGIAAHGDHFLCLERGGYRIVKPLETDYDAQPLRRYSQHSEGKPTVVGNALFAASRVGSAIAIVDISDVEKPRLLREFPTAGNPGMVSVRNGALIIPDAYNGLLIYDDFVKRFDLDVDAKALLGE